MKYSGILLSMVALMTLTAGDALASGPPGPMPTPNPPPGCTTVACPGGLTLWVYEDDPPTPTNFHGTMSFGGDNIRFTGSFGDCSRPVDYEGPFACYQVGDSWRCIIVYANNNPPPDYYFQEYYYNYEKGKWYPLGLPAPAYGGRQH